MLVRLSSSLSMDDMDQRVCAMRTWEVRLYRGSAKFGAHERGPEPLMSAGPSASSRGAC